LDQINQAQGTLFTLRHILQNDQLTITRERIENSCQITLRDFSKNKTQNY